jgi:alkylation response protein AidB-like acyl-CoA dehydrogenase
VLEDGGQGTWSGTYALDRKRFKADRQDCAAILQRVEEIAREVLAPNASKIDQEACWPESNIRVLQSEGLGGLVVPCAHGGRGHGLYMLARVCELLGMECSSTAICYGMHCVGSSVIAANATPDQQERLLTPICEGRHITTLSLSERSTGAHFYLPETTIRAVDSSEYCLSGTKDFVTNGSRADSYVVSAVAAEADAPLGQFSCVVVPGNLSSIEWGPAWKGLGMRGNSSRSMILRNVKVPRSNLLGKEGDQIWYIFNVITPFFVIAMAATYLGIATTAFEEARKHLSHRHHSHTGETLGQNSVLQHRLGSLWSVLDRTRRLIYAAAQNFDAGDPDALTSVMASKVEVAECVDLLINGAMTLTGGIGYAESSKLHRLMRDARAVHLMSPTSDILRLWIGRAMLGTPLLVD